MAGTRKDARGYKLNTGEYQRKDGRYSYKYTDKRRGERRSVYADSLAELRKKERKIIRDIEDGIDPTLADRLTLNELYDKYISEKYDLKPTTKACYIYAYNHFVRGTFGTKKIKSIRYSDVKRFYYELIRERNLKAYTRAFLIWITIGMTGALVYFAFSFYSNPYHYADLMKFLSLFSG